MSKRRISPFSTIERDEYDGPTHALIIEDDFGGTLQRYHLAIQEREAQLALGTAPAVILKGDC